MSCHVGDKSPHVCQSDDQFTVFNYALDHGMAVSMHRSAYPNETIWLTVPDLGVHSAPPFDVDLHRIAEKLRA